MNDKLKNAVEKLCEDLTNAMHTRWELLEKQQRLLCGQKYIRIFSVENGKPSSAWGFINIKEFQKGATGITFKEGDVLKCAGWKTPAFECTKR